MNAIHSQLAVTVVIKQRLLYVVVAIRPYTPHRVCLTERSPVFAPCRTRQPLAVEAVPAPMMNDVDVVLVRSRRMVAEWELVVPILPFVFLWTA